MYALKKKAISQAAKGLWGGLSSFGALSCIPPQYISLLTTSPFSIDFLLVHLLGAQPVGAIAVR